MAGRANVSKTGRCSGGVDDGYADEGLELRPISFVITCEHGGNRIPPNYAKLFRGRRRLLESHRGYDPGALSMARSLSRALGAVHVTSTVSRLLIELNRSPGHPEVYSKVMRKAPQSVRQEVYERYYVPYRVRVENAVRAAVERGDGVVHISSHSFTPRLSGVVRKADVGLLYDPRRASERELCLRWQVVLQATMPGWRIRRNYPYAGASDGLTRYLRGLFPGSVYSGIELEINHKHFFAGDRIWNDIRSRVVGALLEAVGR
jgi:predicted N-formylglutamate amidohydrolase